MKADTQYGIRLSIIYTVLWFKDLLEGTLLYVSLPEISRLFHVDPTEAQWVLIGFLLSMSIGMVVSNAVGNFFGRRRVYLLAQWLYLLSSLACGLSQNFPQLVLFRIFQGLGAGLAIPIGLALTLAVLPHNQWAKVGAWITFFSLTAPALGPILAGYIMFQLGWRWLFFLKLPISLGCILFTAAWVKKTPRQKEKRFDWLGFYFAAFSLSLLLLVCSQVGKTLFSPGMLISLFIASVLLLGAFIWQERRALSPLMPLKIFHFPLFAWGNLVQSAANIIFLGATFIIALYLQWGLGFTMVKSGWMMAAITVGAMSAMPFSGKFYNRWGPLPFIIPGLLLMALSMCAFIWIRPHTSPWLIALIIFCEGFGSAALQSANFISIFSEIPQFLKGHGGSLYSLFKQVSGALGIAISTMALSISMSVRGITTLTPGASQTLFYPSFIVLAAIPLLALIACCFIDNKRALQKIAHHDHLDTEFEHGTE